MEEEEASARAMPLHVGGGEAVVLLADARQIFFHEGERAVLQDDRLDRENIESRIVHREHVLGEVEIALRVGAAKIGIDAAIVPVAACAARKTPSEVFHDTVISAVSADVGTHGVVRLPAPVERQHEREIVLVEPRDVRIVQENAVRRQRELEDLARLLLAPPYMLRHLLDRLHVEERLAAEEVNLTVLARP